MHSRFTTVTGALALTSALALAGCGTPSAAKSEFSVVTSTNVYADIVSQVAGDLAEVSPIIDDPNQDPHSYEATTRDRLKLSEADLVVQNGGGYDSFMTAMLEASDAKVETLDVVSISGLPGSEGLENEPHDHGGEGHEGHEAEGAEAEAGSHEAEGAEHESHEHEAEGHEHEAEGAKAEGTEHEGHEHEAEGHEHEAEGAKAEGAEHEGHEHEGHEHEAEGHEGHDHEHGAFNEHLWYSVPTMTKLVDEVSTHLGEAIPEHKDEFASNATKYKESLGELQSSIDAAKEAHGGEKVAATEPVPLWLFDDMGLENVTPAEFLSAVEEGNDVPPLVLKEAEEQITSGDVVLLGYNTQAAGPQAEQLKSTAEKSDVPVVDLGETMPADTHYADWMGAYIKEIATALEGHQH